MNDRVHCEANPWARQLQQDIDSLSCIEDGECMLESVDHKIFALFNGEKELFLNLDIDQLKSQFMRNSKTGGTLKMGSLDSTKHAVMARFAI